MTAKIKTTLFSGLAAAFLVVLSAQCSNADTFCEYRTFVTPGSFYVESPTVERVITSPVTIDRVIERPVVIDNRARFRGHLLNVDVFPFFHFGAL